MKQGNQRHFCMIPLNFTTYAFGSTTLPYVTKPAWVWTIFLLSVGYYRVQQSLSKSCCMDILSHSSAWGAFQGASLGICGTAEGGQAHISEDDKSVETSSSERFKADGDQFYLLAHLIHCPEEVVEVHDIKWVPHGREGGMEWVGLSLQSVHKFNWSALIEGTQFDVCC